MKSEIEIFLFQEFDKKNLHQRIQSLLSHLLQRSISDGDFLKNSHGKPFLKDHSLYFNISHTKNYALLAVSKDTPVGIDIESIRTDIDSAKLSKRFFCDMEKKWVGDNHEKFCVLWTRKEAFIKAVGRGLSMGLNNIDVLEPIVFYENQKWKIDNIDLKLDGYRAAVCGVGGDWCIRINSVGA